MHLQRRLRLRGAVFGAGGPADVQIAENGLGWSRIGEQSGSEGEPEAHLLHAETLNDWWVQGKSTGTQLYDLSRSTQNSGRKPTSLETDSSANPNGWSPDYMFEYHALPT